MEEAARFSLEGDALPAERGVARFEAVEGISEPYSVVVELTTADASFRVEDCLRSHMCLVVTGGDGRQRFFDGLVDQARFARIAGEQRHFEVRLRPALAALEHREGCRIFQEKSIVDVVRTIFDEAGFGDRVEWRIKGEYEPRELVVQYRETHLNFVSRLLEDGGLFYFFAHGPDGHTLVVADDVSAFGPAEVPLVAFGIGGGGEPLTRFSRTRSLRAGSVDLLDYDFERPESPPGASLDAKEVSSIRHFEYPAGFTKASAGARIAGARMRELRADADVFRGESRAVGLRVGSPFTVDGAAETSLDGGYVLTHLTSRGNQTMFGGARNFVLENELRGVPAGAPYAAPRRATRPRIRGVQTAVVTGSSQQEQALHVDGYGRIKVRFHWDRTGRQDHTSSSWIRVSQVAMGGSMALPRVGWEVSVAFLEGDPDRPIVLGRVYNAEKPPPCALPGGKASGSIKSMSSPGGGGHNEISMSDGGGSQGFGVHAQKDFNVTIGHDKSEVIGVHEEVSVAVNTSLTVGVDETVTIGGSQSVGVGAVLSQVVNGDQSIEVGGDDTNNATCDFVERLEGDRAYSVAGDQITISNGIVQSITGDFNRSVGSLQLTATVSSINDSVVGSLGESVGAVKVQLVGGGHGEQITGDKDQTYAAAELHMTKGDLASTTAGSVETLVGGLHYQKLDGDYVVKAPVITLLGAVGIFKGGSSEIKLGGGPVIVKGSTIAIESALIIKMGSSMKLGS